MKTHDLYTYGTLQVPAIIEHIVGRPLHGVPARLEGYARHRVKDRVYPAIVPAAGGEVPGVLYAALDAAELDRLDLYEGDLYERREVCVWVGSLASPGAAGGVTAGGVASPALATPAVTYVLRPEHRQRLSDEAWDLASFLREHLADYLALVSRTLRAP